MTTMQTRLLARIEAAAGRLTFSNNPEWANTGIAYAADDDTLDVGWTLRYSFQSDRCGLHLSGPAIDALGLTDSPPAFRWERDTLSFHALNYTDGRRLRLLLSIIEEASLWWHAGGGNVNPLIEANRRKALDLLHQKIRGYAKVAS